MRFHSLPLTKRYATSPAEAREVLFRHNVVLQHLVDLGVVDRAGSPTIHVATSSWSASETPVARTSGLSDASPSAWYWQSLQLEDEPGLESWQHLWASTLVGAPGSLDELFLLVADDLTDGVVVMGEDLHWLYHPYDGGADVIAASPEDCSALATRYAAWR